MKKKPDNLIGTILKVLGMILTILVFILSSLRVVDSHTGLGLLSLAVAFFGLYLFSLEKVEKEVIIEEE